MRHQRTCNEIWDFFSIISALLIVAAIMYGGWHIVYLWPAISFGIVAVGYLFVGPRVYGKSQSGVCSPLNTVLLLPYLLYLRGVWHVIRFFKTESAYDQLIDNIYIGRHLMAREFPEFIDHVIDLTCEFTEPKTLRNTDYHSMQILDGFVPDTQQLKTWVANVATLNGTIYIHCAEGHGRTGLFASVLLVHLGHSPSVEDALQLVKSKRPLVRLNSRQRQTLAATQAAQIM